MLEFDTKPSISYKDFVSRCSEQLVPADMEAIQRATIAPCNDAMDASLTLREWKAFECSLRNELARHRAGRHSKDPSRYMRGEGYPDPFTAGLAQWAVNQDSPTDSELFLDRARWDKLGELKKFHYFDIDYLITYALQLQILERWARINSEGGMQVLAGLVEKGQT